MALTRVNSAGIAQGTVIASDIADGAITAAKLGTVYAANITGLGDLALVDSITTSNVTNIGTIATQDSDSVTITGGTIAGISTLGANVTTLAGNVDFDFNGTVAQNIVAVGASSIDCSTGNYFTKTISGTTTFTFDNVPVSRRYGFILELTNGGSQTVNWPGAVTWPAATAPTLTASGVDLLIFITSDSGTTWYGSSLVNYT